MDCTTEHQPRLLRVDEAARLLGVSRATAYNLVRSGDLRTVTIGRSRRVSMEALDSYVTRLGHEQQAPA